MNAGVGNLPARNNIGTASHGSDKVTHLLNYHLTVPLLDILKVTPFLLCKTSAQSNKVWPDQALRTRKQPTPFYFIPTPQSDCNFQVAK